MVLIFKDNIQVWGKEAVLIFIVKVISFKGDDNILDRTMTHLTEFSALCGEGTESSGRKNSMRMVAHNVVLGRVQLGSLNEMNWEEVFVVLP